jgi:hypothetical protein
MVRGAGLDKLLKAVWMQKANEMMWGHSFMFLFWSPYFCYLYNT